MGRQNEPLLPPHLQYLAISLGRAEAASPARSTCDANCVTSVKKEHCQFSPLAPPPLPWWDGRTILAETSSRVARRQICKGCLRSARRRKPARSALRTRAGEGRKRREGFLRPLRRSRRSRALSLSVLGTDRLTYPTYPTAGRADRDPDGLMLIVLFNVTAASSAAYPDAIGRKKAAEAVAVAARRHANGNEGRGRGQGQVPGEGQVGL